MTDDISDLKGRANDPFGSAVARHERNAAAGAPVPVSEADIAAAREYLAMRDRNPFGAATRSATDPSVMRGLQEVYKQRDAERAAAAAKENEAARKADVLADGERNALVIWRSFEVAKRYSPDRAERIRQQYGDHVLRLGEQLNAGKTDFLPPTK